MQMRLLVEYRKAGIKTKYFESEKAHISRATISKANFSKYYEYNNYRYKNIAVIVIFPIKRISNNFLCNYN